jgi:hypothetical protein
MLMILGILRDNIEKIFGRAEVFPVQMTQK